MKLSRNLNKGILATVVFALFAAFALAGCSGQPLSTREKGTLGGGVLGAGAGAIIGAAVGSASRFSNSRNSSKPNDGGGGPRGDEEGGIFVEKPGKPGNFRRAMTAIAVLSMLVVTLAGCGPQGMSTTTEGTVGGGVLGGGAGAIVGAAVGHPLAGAAIGGALGAGTGYVVGSSLESQQAATQQQQGEIQNQQQQIQSQRRQIQQLQQQQQTE
jgi:osmotically inducible lipoprotein OsmB